MKWKPTAKEKDWIRKTAADAANLLAGQVTLDAKIDNESIVWSDFVRRGLDLDVAKSVTFDVYEMTGFGAERQRAAKKAEITVHVKPSRPPEVVYIS